MTRAYFRFPTVFQDKIVFTSEDDLWEVGRNGGVARRLTAGRGMLSHPHYSPDGQWLTFASAEEGHYEVYVMPSNGGDVKRLTYLGDLSIPCGWQNQNTILFSSPAFEAHFVTAICRVDISGGLPEPLLLGPARGLALSATGMAVLNRGRSSMDPAHWKRYRGGTAGKLWVAPSINDEFKPLIELDGNLMHPLWIGARVYFISDHEGMGNLYSCAADGAELRRETAHEDFYARTPATDGSSIVYHAGGDLYVFDVATRTSRKLAIEYNSQRTQRQRRFVQVPKYLETADLDSKGERTVLSIRGQIHLMRHWDGPVSSHVGHGNRYRLARFLADGRVITVVDKDNGDERLEIWDSEDYTASPVPMQTEDEIAALDQWGRFTLVEPSPKENRIAFANHRNELWTLDLSTGAAQMLSKNHFRSMGRFAWSPDGRWLAFQHGENRHQQRICIANVETGEIHPITEPLFDDFAPSFDPEGRYLYFLSDRKLNPVYDTIQFELSFPKTVLPCLVTLCKDVPSPFLKAVEDDGKSNKVSETDADTSPKIEIDFDGISERILTFPVQEGRYRQIAGLKNKVIWLSFPVEGALGEEIPQELPVGKGRLEAYDFKTLRIETLGSGFWHFRLSADTKWIMLFTGPKVRVAKAGEKLNEAAARENPGRNSGWLDLQRPKVLIEPAAEWRQMLHEAWRLQRDHFWRADMSKVNWTGVLARYLPLVERVNCRSEFNDLVWEMQGELGTSHAYSSGGDFRDMPRYPVGFLGADFSFDPASGGYRIKRCLPGNPWMADEACPLRAPGVLLETGDIIVAVNGQRLSREMTPHEALLHQAGAEIHLTVRTADGAERKVCVRPLRNERKIRYRTWVEQNRDHVREASGGRVGYIHIPNMMPLGFAEFHRHFLRDYDCDGLIVDVRFNGGGHVSQLLLEKLCRKRLGMNSSRWFGTYAVPSASPAGPLVALTNEYAGSDGDIFSHTFKLAKVGPLIGRRTWGGVIGISPRHRLIDGGMTTQPEFANWFTDVGWSVENYGTDPDIDVDIAPHEYRQGKDPQLDRSIAEVLALIETQPPFRPNLDKE